MGKRWENHVERQRRAEKEERKKKKLLVNTGVEPATLALT